MCDYLSTVCVLFLASNIGSPSGLCKQWRHRFAQIGTKWLLGATGAAPPHADTRTGSRTARRTLAEGSSICARRRVWAQPASQPSQAASRRIERANEIRHTGGQTDRQASEQIEGTKCEPTTRTRDHNDEPRRNIISIFVIHIRELPSSFNNHHHYQELVKTFYSSSYIINKWLPTSKGQLQ